MNLSKLSPSELAHVLKKVEEVQKSDGWEIMKQIMAFEREEFFRKMAEPKASIVPEVLHYNRGIIEGTYRVCELPDKIIAVIQNSLALSSASTQSTTAPLQSGTP